MNYQNNDYFSIIEKNRERFTQDMLHDIIDNLREEGVLTDEEYNQIMDNKQFVLAKEFPETADRCINILLKKKASEIEKFVDLLKDDYYWLYSLFPPSSKAIEEPLILGGVPKKPKRHVLRTALHNNVKNNLFKLKRGHFLVLHGMTGCGKSTLAAECLYNKELLNYFDNHVMWVSIGYEADLSSLQNVVNSFLPEAVGNLTGNIRQDLVLIRKQLSNKEYLLVLDDVPSKKAVDALNFGCKILITTNDQNIMEQHESATTFIEVNASFEEEETLLLFSRAVGESPEQLPHEAKVINSLTRGFPMSISLLGGYLEENKERALMKDSNIWHQVKSVLNTKDSGLRKFSMGDSKQLSDVIGLSVDSLDAVLKALFMDFALFVEDINIKSMVLGILWSLDLLTVETYLLRLVRKSLLVRKWIGKSYVYGIHDCILYYLKECLSEEEKKALHNKLIHKYKSQCPNGDLSKLPTDDNYIFFYLGYHLKNAQELSEFPTLYLNLEFIEAKLQAVGPAELLSDYTKYLKEITTGQECIYNNVREIQLFTERCGQSIYLNAKNSDGEHQIDIVQFIFQEMPVSSYLYRSALRLADSRQPKSYIRYPLGPSSKTNYPSETLPYQKDVSCIKFTNLPNVILIGYENGNISMYNIVVKKTVFNYTGLSHPVRGLDVNVNDTYFLAYTGETNDHADANKKSVLIWPLFTGDDSSQHCATDSFAFSEPRTPSPSRIQENHSQLWAANAGVQSVQSLKHTIPVTCSVYSAKDPALIASCTTYSVIVWKNNVELWNKRVRCEVTSCTFCRDDTVLITGSDKLSVFNAADGTILSNMADPRFTSPIINLFSDPENSNTIFVATKHNISNWSFEENEKNLVEVYDEPFHQVCVKKYIAVAYSDADIWIIDKNTSSSLEVFHKPNGEVKCMAMDKERLLAAYGDKTLCVWPLSHLNRQVPALPSAPVSFVWSNASPYIASASNKSSILIKKERELIVEIRETKDVTLLDLCSDITYIAYACKNNRLYRCSLNNLKQKEYQFDSAPAFIHSYSYKGEPLVLAASRDGQLLVWLGDDMKFFGNRSSRFYNAYLVNENIVCISEDKGIELFSIEGSLQDVIGSSKNVSPGCSNATVISTVISCSHLAIISKDKQNCTEYLEVYELSSFEVFFERQLSAHCISMAFSPNGLKFAVALELKEIMLFNMGSKEYRMLQGTCLSECMAITNDGMIGFRQKASLCLMDSERESHVGHASMTSMPLTRPFLSASPDSTLFATLDSTGVIHTFCLFKRNTSS